MVESTVRSMTGFCRRYWAKRSDPDRADTQQPVRA